MPRSRVTLLALLMLLGATITAAARAENIDPEGVGARYAWGENVGWLNAEPLGEGGPGVAVSNTALGGYLWGENIGWISLSCANTASCANVAYGVANDGKGRLSGYAWGENVGWIDFAPATGGVSIDACGDFAGAAWGENVGWILFRSAGPVPFRVSTAWTSPIDAVAPETAPATPLPDWFAGDAQIVLAASDCGSGVQAIRYRLDGGPETLVEADTASVAVLGDGIHTLTFFAVDLEGNAEALRSETVRIDATPPQVTLSTPADGASYLVNQPVTVSFAASDATSGVALLVATQGNGTLLDTGAPGARTFTVSATDAAGNGTSVSHTYRVAFAGNIDPGDDASQYAWSENLGWINFQPSFGPGVTVSDRAVTGFAWSGNAGWIDLAPPTAGVTNDGNGVLGGYAWGENIGWISFSCTNTGSCERVSYGVHVDPVSGRFSGHAWAENAGWIGFAGDTPVAYRVATSWRGAPAPGDIDADGDVDREDLDVLMLDRNRSVPESSCGAACDLDADGVITVLDARRLVLLCTRPSCATE